MQIEKVTIAGPRHSLRIMKIMKKIAAGAFKTRCLQVMKEVQATREPVVITKRGTPVVKVMPAAPENGEVFGFMAGEFRIVGDIESPMIPSRQFGEKRRRRG